jgi:hypothetical protein
MSEEEDKNPDEYKRDSRGWFVPGNKPGPGRKKGSTGFSLKRALERAIEKTETEDGRSVLDALAVAAIKAAQQGDFRFWKEIIDRFDGPIRQQIEQDQTVWIERVSRQARQIEHEDDTE